MSRRHAATALAATSLLAALAPSNAEDAPLFPRLNCARQMNDPASDAKYTLQGSGASAVPRPSDTSVDPIDILNASLRSNETVLETYIGVKDATKAFAAYETAYSWEVTFENADGAKFTIAHMVTNPQYDTADVKPSNWQTYPTAKYQIGTSGGAILKDVKARIQNNFVIVTVPLTEIQRGFADPIRQGITEVTKVSASSYAHIPNTGPASQRPADSATSTVTYQFGDEYCFGPPPAALSALTLPKVQYTDSVKLTAKLASEAGEALAGKQVEFAVDGLAAPLKGTTNAAGLVTVTFKPTSRAGTYPVVARFRGDETHGKTLLSGEILVLAENTRFNTLSVAKPTTTTRRVTATLVDDDKRAVAGQKVVWYVNGKKATTQTTNSKGQVVLTTAKPGQTVHAVFTAVAGKFNTATAKAVKV
ncbi:MAG TPA: Ig-like domain-containing protein [Frankiaceae bacterium]|nr:Ig-like domain-containing protein [Frankiaceae bacterium]